jgi:hypothetical protein
VEALRHLDAGVQSGDTRPDVEPVQRQVAALGAQRPEAVVLAADGHVAQLLNDRHRGTPRR